MMTDELPSSFAGPRKASKKMMRVTMTVTKTTMIIMTMGWIVLASGSWLTATSAYDFTCNLYCYHGGTCRHGHGKFGSLNSQTESKYAGISDEETAQLPFEQVHHEQGMFCTCPVGYTGLQCEIKLVVCGRDDHTCFNGSTCAKERSGEGEIYFRCECDPKESVMDAPYAGKYCEHIATVFCDGHGISMGQSFCTNGGKCKERENPDQQHVGCDCPNGYHGDHCEIASSAHSITEVMHQATSKKSVGALVAIVIGSVVGVVTVFFVKERFIDRPRRERARMNAMTPGMRAQAELSTRRNRTRGIV